jgi:RecB family exonuclease
VITSRTTRLVRVADLQGFHHAILECLPTDPFALRDCAVIVPSRGAAEELRRTLENLAFRTAAARAWPDLVTRDDFYANLRERLPGAPEPLSPFAREVLLRRSARGAHVSGAAPPFNLRPRLIREILALYDELRRRHKTVAGFARLMIGALEPGADSDRGAARLLDQTHFLVATFEAFELALTDLAAVDEHQVRALALRSPRPLYRRVVVTVADQNADSRGLWAADFDLLARMPELETIDVIATEALLEAGYYTRLHESALPGIEDVRYTHRATAPPVLIVPDPLMRRSDTDGTASNRPSNAPLVSVDAGPAADSARAFTCRDREEELVEFARVLKSTSSHSTSPSRTAIVFQRPLPYLYLAGQVFEDAQIPYRALDALPLAAEPFAAAVDLVFSAIAADFTRGAVIDLLRSPHFRFGSDGAPLPLDAVHALDRFLVKKKYLGGAERLSELAAAHHASDVAESIATAAAIAQELTQAAGASTAPEQIDGILAFITARERLPDRSDAWSVAHARARAAVLSALQMLRDAHAALDSAALSIAELSGAVRRWIEGQTFSPRLGDAGVALLETHAARYADVDELRIVGLTETDWPERTPRSIFYPQSLLAQLGWPDERERLAAARAQFQDLLHLPRRRVSLSCFTLEDDSIVSPSPFLEEVSGANLSIERLVTGAAAARMFRHEALAIAPLVAAALPTAAAEWLTLRTSRSVDAPHFRGAIGPRVPEVYAVSRLERYLECPFKYFAAHVLKLPEERDVEAWMSPQERGQFVHDVFEAFFSEWQARQGDAITTGNVAEAMTLFEAVAERHLAVLPEGDRALERTLLLGSAAAAGFGERAFAFEIEDAIPLVERLLEFQLEGTFTFAGPDGERRVKLRSKADRIDLLQNGTLRIVDYKIGRAPEKKRALQLPVYGVCASQALDGRHGRSWTVARAGYIAFREKTAFTELQHPEKALPEGEARLLKTIDAIERGEFPVRPDEPFLCNWCAYPGVCRKDYVGDELEDK